MKFLLAIRRKKREEGFVKLRHQKEKWRLTIFRRAMTVLLSMIACVGETVIVRKSTMNALRFGRKNANVWDEKSTNTAGMIDSGRPKDI